ncbi:hypothetical protein Tco_0013887 [Tanacetum coccineum]
MCDKKNSVFFTDTECVVLSPDFKLLDESQVLLRVPRKNYMYSVDLKNVVPSGGDKSQGQRVKGRKETHDIFLGYFGGKIGLGILGVKFVDLTYLAPQPYSCIALLVLYGVNFVDLAESVPQSYKSSCMLSPCDIQL